MRLNQTSRSIEHESEHSVFEKYYDNRPQKRSHVGEKWAFGLNAPLLNSEEYLDSINLWKCIKGNNSMK